MKEAEKASKKMSGKASRKTPEKTPEKTLEKIPKKILEKSLAKKWAKLAAGMMLAGMLTACGDNAETEVPAVWSSDLLQPLQESTEQAGTGSNAQASGGSTDKAEGAGMRGDADTGKDADMEDGAAAGYKAGMGEGAASIGGEGKEGTFAAEGAGGTVIITISAAGDVTLGNHREQDYYYSFRQAYDQAEDKNYFFENVKDIFEADDMTIVNLEGPLTLSEQYREGQTYSIKGDPEYAQLLTLGSIEAVSMGNNHRLDYGEQGSQDTVKALEQEGIVYAYDSVIGIYEVEGIRIGFVSVNEACWGAQVEKDLENGIAQLKEEGADLIFACCHWGTERDNYPENYQTQLGRKCIDWGADLVIGHHPHVLQGIDQYQGKYIIYSLGNFCFGANRNPADKDTMIFQQTFTFVDGEKQEDAQARIIPCYVSSVSSRNDFKPTPAEGEEARRIIGRINEYSQAYGVNVDEEGNLTATK